MRTCLASESLKDCDELPVTWYEDLALPNVKFQGYRLCSRENTRVPFITCVSPSYLRGHMLGRLCYTQLLLLLRCSLSYLTVKFEFS